MLTSTVINRPSAVSQVADTAVPYHPLWLTTADAARMLERTTRGVRWLADQAHLPCVRTQSRQRLFHKSTILRLVQQRADARFRGVKVLRPRKVGVPGEPRQLALFGPRLRIVHQADSLPHAEVQREDFLKEPPWVP